MNIRRALRVFAAALALSLAAPAAALAQADFCRASVVYDASTNGSTVLVTGRAATQIYLCGYTLVGGGTATVKLVYGTGTACATGETAITPAYSMLAQTVIPDSSPNWRGLRVPAANDLCIKTSAGVAIQGIFYYVQQ